MKSLFQIVLLCIAAIGISLSISSCKKNSTPPATTYGVLGFHLHTDIDTNEVDSGLVRKDAGGRYFSLSVAKFYISGIALHASNGDLYPLNHVYVLKDMGNEVYYVSDSVPTGNYVSVSFNVGIDAAANLLSPANYTSANPLSDASMWFGSTSKGYIFMNIQGMADTSAMQTGNANFPFSYQLGTSSMVEIVAMPNHAAFSVISKDTVFIHMIADYGKALNGINFKTQSYATPFVNASVAQQIANNISTMFRYEE